MSKTYVFEHAKIPFEFLAFKKRSILDKVL